MRRLLSIVSILCLFCLAVAGQAFGQANANKAVLHFGASYNKSMVDDAGGGFFGIDTYAGKMVTNELCVGFYAGYDIIHNETLDIIDEVTLEPGTFHERLAVIPFEIRAKYYVTLSPMVQFYGGLGGGVYRTLPSLGGNGIGPVKSAANCPGGSVSVGLDYWFLLTTGVGFEFQYSMFNVPDGDTYSYWNVKVNYSLIKF